MKLNQVNINTLEKKIFTILLSALAIIVTIYISLDSYVFSNQFQTITLNNALTKIEERESYLQQYINESKIKLKSIKNSSFFNDFINNNEKKSLNNLFLFTLNNQKNIMQIRYIDKDGKEQLRVERKTSDEEPVIVNHKDLQNKVNRDYFIKSKNIKDENIWFSSLNLNSEFGKIQQPYKSTFRAILPLQKGNQFNGIIIINYFMNELLHSFIKDGIYNSILVDKDGFIMIHYEQDKNWGKYQNPQIKFTENNKILNQEFVQGKDFVSKILDLPLEENIVLILKLNEKYLLEEKYNKLISKFSISSIIVIFSIITILIISKILRKLLLGFTSYKEYTKLIDENIIVSTTDLKGKIIFTSKAFCKISGYEEIELLGRNHNIVRHEDEDKNKYKALWKCLTNGKIWEGELKNKRKNGEVYWVKAKIYPTFEKGIKTGYTAIRQEITDKKIIEEIAIHDGLTSLYNRTYFDKILPKFINSIKRNKKLVSLIMIDIDYFKQYNDTYGHQEGDHVLIEVSKVFKNLFQRANDFSFRIGGEEFVILFSPDSENEAIQVANKVRQSVEDLKILHSGNKSSSFVTISIGIITDQATNISDFEKIYKEADDLLYQSKKNGRNKISYK